MRLPFRLLNVFAIEGDAFSGNPLAVFEDPPDALDGATMQRLARQFNLSESTFVTLGDSSTTGEPDATVRIFTPTVELPFAGHPTVGTAYVVGQRVGREAVVLRMSAGDIPVRLEADRWTLTANPATVVEALLGAAELAHLLGLQPADLAGAASWVDAGMDQLLVPLTTPDAVRRAVPNPEMLGHHAMSRQGEAMCLAWAFAGEDAVEARFFFTQDAGVVEDPATGSAAANLGSLLALLGHRDVLVTIDQGAAVKRPSRLTVAVDGAGVVTVGGRVHEIGSGAVELA